MHLNCLDVANDFALSVFCDGATQPGCKLLPQNVAAVCAAPAPAAGPSAAVIAGSVVGAVAALAGIAWCLRSRSRAAAAARNEQAPLLKGAARGTAGGAV